MINQEQQIFEQIKKANYILIAFRKDYNGDSIASALAMYLFLKKLDKQVDVAAENLNIKNKEEKTADSLTDPELKNIVLPVNGLFSFLPSYNEIKNYTENLRKFIISLDITNTKVSQIKYKVDENKLNFIISPSDGFFTHEDITSRSDGFKYDLIIVLDTPDLESLGVIYDNDTEFFYKTPIINIDHNANNEEFGQINNIQLTAVATAEIIFSLFSGYSRDLIDDDIATCLLAGMIAKTRSFKTSNVTPSALLAASQLISMGARREDIVNRLYRCRPLNVLQLWGRVLARLSSSLDNKLIWSTLSNIDFIKTNSSERDLTDVIDELIINIPQANVIVIIYEKESILNQPPVEKSSAVINENKPNEDNKITNESIPWQMTEPSTPLLASPPKFNRDEADNQAEPNTKIDQAESENKEKKSVSRATHVTVYSIKNIDSRNLIKEFKPSGTKSLATAIINKPVQEAEKEVIALIKERLNRLPI